MIKKAKEVVKKVVSKKVKIDPLHLEIKELYRSGRATIEIANKTGLTKDEVERIIRA